MTRNRFLCFLFIGPFLIGLGVILLDRILHTSFFNSKWYMTLSICIYIPVITYLRSRFLQIPSKEFLLSLLPVFGSKRHWQLFRKP